MTAGELPGEKTKGCNGNPIPGATKSFLTISNIGLADAGSYQVTITDSFGSLLSPPASLTILINPVILVPPISISVPQGGTGVFSVQVSNTVTLPISYRWIQNGRTTSSQMLNSYVSLLLVTNVQADSGPYSVVITNIARFVGVVGGPATLTMLADADHDGIPDETETALGLDLNNPADARGDLDGDGVSNLAEFIAGTNPKDATSYLKIEPSPKTGPATIQFNAVADRTYSVQYVDRLGTNRWLKLGDVAARTNNRVETLFDPSFTTNRFYRLVVPAQP